MSKTTPSYRETRFGILSITEIEGMEMNAVFLKDIEHGFPPMTGSGFEIDRLITLFSGQGNLRDVLLFPTMRPIPVQNEEKNEK